MTGLAAGEPLSNEADLSDLLADPELAFRLSRSEALTRLRQVRAGEARYRALADFLVARLAGASEELGLAGRNGRDRLLTAQDVSAQTTLSVGWLYRHADALPFTRRVGRKVLFSEAGLDKWLVKRGP